MAELVLSSVGNALGARLPGALGVIGGIAGAAGGAILGRAIDDAVFGARIRREGPRLADFHVQASSEGASIPAVLGSVRLAGQVIWAARLKEHAETTRSGGGGKGGARTTSTNYRYTLSFAVGLCEGVVARIGRVWANGAAFDLSSVTWRLHRGEEDQSADPLIEAIEGAAHAPAYRGLAYMVFEDMPLEQFGNVMPQLSFEVMRPARVAQAGDRFEDRVKGVCMIPGSGEFVYATAPVRRVLGPGQEAPENVHLLGGQANFAASLDQLATDFPNCETVLLVCAWFGDDLRCGQCQIRPGVELENKHTVPATWRAGSVGRGEARVVSQHDGAPAYGGTPDDLSVLQAIALLKARGYKVGLYPFVLMDVPAGNALADPYGEAAQAAYPWRGRITLDVAPGRSGSPDKTAGAADQVLAFFGAAGPAHFGANGGAPTYAGPAEWSYRRFILHYAKLAALAGGVDLFIIGSEMRGLTTARSAATTFPAVGAFKALAADVRAMVGGVTKLTYAADWSEYSGHRPQDGSGDVLFHLDPLWADSNIDMIGVDWYPPLSDWREGAAHLDAQLARNAHDESYLISRIEAGESYDWHYASAGARQTQTRTPITDGAHNEPWIYRAKDLRNFWARAHYDRPGGVRAATPTDWAPQSKPIWLIELGCPAVDKGANAPNVFVDPKSAESALPPFSSGARDDLIQRRTLDAYLRYWHGGAGDNPTSSVNGKPMIEKSFLWCWDARPFPAFPARTEVWSDGPAWRLGHWLNGRAGLSGLGEVVAELCGRAGVSEIEVSRLRGAVSGYVVDSPSTPRAALEPLMAAYNFTASERDGLISFFHRGEAQPMAVSAGALTAGALAGAFAQRRDGAEAPIEARLRFLDPARDYLVAGVSARRLDRAEGGVESIDAPLVMDAQDAEAIAQRVLSDRRAASEEYALELGPAHVALEAGDSITLDGGEAFEIVRTEDAEARRMDLRRVGLVAPHILGLPSPSAPAPPRDAPRPVFNLIDAPVLPGGEADVRPLAALFAQPWRGAHQVLAGVDDATVTHRAWVTDAAVMGELMWALWPGPVDRWDEGNRFRIKLYGGALTSAAREAILAGANAFAIQSGDEWEIVQARACVLVGANEYELSGLLRGCLGSRHAMAAPHPVGVRIVKLDAWLPRLDVGAHEWGEALRWVVPSQGAVLSDPRAARADIVLTQIAERPWAPAHLRARRCANGDVAVSWVRCARFGGDGWGVGEPPLGAAAEAYIVEIWKDGLLVRQSAVALPAWLYSAAAQAEDFDEPPASFRVRVAQMGDGGRVGLKTELTLAL